MRSSMLVLASVTLACGSSTGRSAGDGLRGDPVPVLPLPEEAYYRFHSGACAPSFRVVRTSAEWAATWAELTARYDPAPEPPAVDFTADMLLVATMGERPTGGFAIDVERAEVAGGTLRAHVLETSPGPTCATTLALTCPADVVRVGRRDGPVEAVTRAAVHDCAP